jgi:hypothetical protein
LRLKISLILGFLTKAQVIEDEGDDYDEKRFKKIDTNGDGKMRFLNLYLFAFRNLPYL